jgi:Domain of unknown function (DUF1902)
MLDEFDVKVTWDAEAEMWVADSDNIPGLAAEAPDRDSLVKKLSSLIPELLALNEVKLDATSGINVILHFHREERIQLPHAA